MTVWLYVPQQFLFLLPNATVMYHFSCACSYVICKQAETWRRITIFSSQ